jgi:long-chain acyl-CoA synthetase
MRLAQPFVYHNDPAKTAATRSGEFFTVGDLGYLDDDDYLFLLGRRTDLIISGGVNIYPAEIEAVLVTHANVADAAVFGIPDAEWGERIKAVVQPAPGIEPGPALAEELLAWCKTQLAPHKCPRSIDFTATLPREANGKLYKRALRDPYWTDR